MKLKKILILLVLFSLLLLALFGCKDDATIKSGTQIFLKNIETGEDIGDPIIREGEAGTSENIRIPYVDGYAFVGNEIANGDFILVEHADPLSTYILPYMKVDALAPNQGRVIFTFVDQANGTILHTDQVIGEIGSSKKYTNTFTKEGYVLSNYLQDKIDIWFHNYNQVITIFYIAGEEDNTEYTYTINYLNTND
ncbi:MAG: hypothetical protein ACOX24_06625 [Christensenellales bacterium]